MHDERNTKLRQLTGYDMEKLLELFAAGYTLEPPAAQKYESLTDVLKEAPDA